VAFDIRLRQPQQPAQVQPVPQFGDAQWVKVYKLELNNKVELDELMAGKPAVPEAPMAAEAEWMLTQLNTTSDRRGVRHAHELGNGSHAVVRGYEHYLYTGKYDAVTHQALCAIGITCSARPKLVSWAYRSRSEFSGKHRCGLDGSHAQRQRKVTDGTGKISCGRICTVTADGGTQMTLRATPPAGSVFTGWTGTCAGAQTTCTLAVNDALTVGAKFTPIFNMVMQTNGSGLVLGTPYGESGSFVSCGNQCSASFSRGPS